jgi:hypothetical protein
VTGSIPEAAEPTKSTKSGGWFSGWFGSSSPSSRPNAARAEDRMTTAY